jgi:type 1 fimbria pilin
MPLRLPALAGLLAAFLLVVGSATADSGTFSGSITPTSCGPMQPITVAPGDTTIVAAAAETISANDITLELYDPSGALTVHGDTATSPESVPGTCRSARTPEA